MYKVPKQRYTQEFKQEAVRQLQSEAGVRRRWRGNSALLNGRCPTGARQGYEAGREWWQADQARADGVIAAASRECPAQDGSRNPGKATAYFPKVSRRSMPGLTLSATPTRWQCFVELSSAVSEHQWLC